jgi:hypothetical protein
VERYDPVAHVGVQNTAAGHCDHVEPSRDLDDWPEQRPSPPPADPDRRRVWLRRGAWPLLAYGVFWIVLNLVADGPPNWWALVTAFVFVGQGGLFLTITRPSSGARR